MFLMSLLPSLQRVSRFDYELPRYQPKRRCAFTWNPMLSFAQKNVECQPETINQNLFWNGYREVRPLWTLGGLIKLALNRIGQLIFHGMADIAESSS